MMNQILMNWVSDFLTQMVCLDVTTNDSTTNDDFIEYEYTEDGLEEFTAFAIKIRMQSSNSAQPPRIKDLRAIALQHNE